MNYLLKIWQYLDGKKVNIGATLLFLSTLATQWIIGVNRFDPHWLDVIILNLNYIGGVLTVGGLTHQAVKASTANKVAKTEVVKSDDGSTGAEQL